MHGLILAGGDGSRLAASGILEPKALVPVGGQPQLLRLVEACQRIGCETVTCAVREDLIGAARAALGNTAVSFVTVRTPTSLHTLQRGLGAIGPGNVLCTLVDTVMPAIDWDRAHAEGVMALEVADAAIAVTSYVADDSPLWVDATQSGQVRAIGRRGDRDLVTGGVYWLGPRARAEVVRAVHDGVGRVRGYLARLLESGLVVQAITVQKIVDIDTRADLEDALALVQGESA